MTAANLQMNPNWHCLPPTLQARFEAQELQQGKGWLPSSRFRSRAEQRGGCAWRGHRVDTVSYFAPHATHSCTSPIIKSAEGTVSQLPILCPGTCSANLSWLARELKIGVARLQPASQPAAELDAAPGRCGQPGSVAGAMLPLSMGTCHTQGRHGRLSQHHINQEELPRVGFYSGGGLQAWSGWGRQVGAPGPAAF